LQEFEKWAIDFAGPINPQETILGERYIITATHYLKKWEEETPVTDCIVDTIEGFLFKNVVTMFGRSHILLSDQGKNFLNNTIAKITKDFYIHHQNITPYHPKANKIVEYFNKILESASKKHCNLGRDDWELRVHANLWAYRTTCKNLTGYTPLRLVFGKEAVMPMEFIFPSLCIVAITKLSNTSEIEDILAQIVNLEEDWIVAGFHQ
jgi:hypothetical protein